MTTDCRQREDGAKGWIPGRQGMHCGRHTLFSPCVSPPTALPPRQAGGATVRPRTLCFAMVRATSPVALMSSMKARRYAAPAGRPFGVPAACWTGEVAVENARAKEVVLVRHQAWPGPASASSLSVTKVLERGIGALETHQLGVLQTAAQIEFIRTPRRRRNADTWTIHLGDACDRRAGWRRWWPQFP